MKIIVQTEEKNINFSIPTLLLKSSLIRKKIAKEAVKHTQEMELDQKLVEKFLDDSVTVLTDRELRGLELVHIESDEVIVSIIL